MIKYKLMEIDGYKIISDIELTKYEFAQAIIMHNRLKQRKER